MGNIIVGDGSVINAGSVVTKPVAPYTRIGGVPARVISTFSVNQTYIAELAQLKYIDEMHYNASANGGQHLVFPKSYTDTV